VNRLLVFASGVLVLTGGPACAANTQFWNLTKDKIVSLQISPAGKANWGQNQTDNDPDHSVDPDERLKITGTPAGTYDVRFTDARGRTCTVANVVIDSGKIFSIDEAQLSKCSK